MWRKHKHRDRQSGEGGSSQGQDQEEERRMKWEGLSLSATRWRAPHTWITAPGLLEFFEGLQGPHCFIPASLYPSNYRHCTDKQQHHSNMGKRCGGEIERKWTGHRHQWHPIHTGSLSSRRSGGSGPDWPRTRLDHQASTVQRNHALINAMKPSAWQQEKVSDWF